MKTLKLNSLQTSEINQTSASALDISYGQEGEAGHCVSFRDEETGQRMLQVNSEVTIFDQVQVWVMYFITFEM